MAQIVPARAPDTGARERAVPSLCAEGSLVAIHAAVAASDAALIQDQIALFKALGGVGAEPLWPIDEPRSVSLSEPAPYTRPSNNLNNTRGPRPTRVIESLSAPLESPRCRAEHGPYRGR